MLYTNDNRRKMKSNNNNNKNNKNKRNNNETNSDSDDEGKKFNWGNFQESFMKENDYRDVVKYTLNEKNKEITSNHIMSKLREYGLTEEDYEGIKNLKLYKTAMTHKSYTVEFQPKSNTDKNFKKLFMGINFMNGEVLNPIDEKDINSAIGLKEESYEKLEFVGDSIIRLILSLYLSKRYIKKREGFLTKARTELENAETLSLLAKKLDLHKYVLISRNNEIAGARDLNQKIQCDLFEAFIGALYCDICRNENGCEDYDKSGKATEICYKFIEKMLEKEINIPKLLKKAKNYKDFLVQIFHKLGYDEGSPEYGMREKTEDKNNMGKQYFHMYVRDNDGNIIGEGVGTSKKKGQKEAAKQAYKMFKNKYPNIIEDYSDDNECDDESLSSNDSVINKKINKINYKNKIVEHFLKLGWGNPSYKVKVHDFEMYKIYNVSIFNNKNEKISSGENMIRDKAICIVEKTVYNLTKKKIYENEKNKINQNNNDDISIDDNKSENKKKNIIVQK